jgi:serine/threonine/tyrosine-interacting protein
MAVAFYCIFTSSPGVRHIIERRVIREMHPEHFTYLVIEMPDDFNVNLIPHVKLAHKFMDDCFASGGKVLVHGNAGISRSGAIVVAYVMATYGVALRTAMKFVQGKRLAVSPNEWFLTQLRDYEAIYQAAHDVPKPLPGPGDTTRPSLKRDFKLYEDDGDDEVEDHKCDE